MAINERKGARRQGRVRGRVPGAPARGDRRAAQPLQARRREAVRGRRGDLGVQPARLRAVRAAARPVDVATSSTAKLARQFHPLRVQRWAFSDLNPWLAWLGPAAQMRARRSASRSAADDSGAQGREDRCPRRSARRSTTTARCATRRARRRSSRPTATCSRCTSPTSTRREEREAASVAEPRELPFVKEALASIDEGGYRGGAGARRLRCSRGSGAPLPLARLAAEEGADRRIRATCCPTCAPDQWRRIRGEQDIIVRYEPERAIATLPSAARRPGGPRAAGRRSCARLLADERMQRSEAVVRAARDAREHRRDARRASRSARAAARGRKPRPREAGDDSRREAPRAARSGRYRNGTRTREIPAAARFLQGAAADADGGRASVRRELAAGRRRRGAAGTDRADPGRPAGADRGGREAVRHRHRRPADRRRRAQPGFGRRRRSRWCARARPRR